MTEQERQEKAWQAVENWGCSYAEGYQMILDDELVDRSPINKPLFEWDLTPEQKKESKKARSTVSVEGKKTPKTKTRKEDVERQALISILEKSLSEAGADVNVTNIEREMSFQYAGRTFKLTLSVPRG